MYHDDNFYSGLLLQVVVLVLDHKTSDKSLFGYILNKYLSNQQWNNTNVLTIDTFVDFIENGFQFAN